MEILRSAAIAGDSLIGGVYVLELAKQMGEEYQLIVRDPDSIAGFDISTTVSRETLMLIARKWIRVGGTPNLDEKDRPLFLRSENSVIIFAKELEEQRIRIKNMWGRLKRCGTNIREA